MAAEAEARLVLVSPAGAGGGVCAVCSRAEPRRGLQRPPLPPPLRRRRLGEPSPSAASPLTSRAATGGRQQKSHAEHGCAGSQLPAGCAAGGHPALAVERVPPPHHCPLHCGRDQALLPAAPPGGVSARERLVGMPPGGQSQGCCLLAGPAAAAADRTLAPASGLLHHAKAAPATSPAV